MNFPILQDNSLVGVGEVMNKFKGKFEAKEVENVPIAHGVHIKKKVMPQALQFQINEKKEQELVSTPSKANTSTEWSWKKKDPNQLAAEMALSGIQQQPKKTRERSRREEEKADRQRELLDDIKTINNRLLKKDAAKEHEQKMQEYASFMQEIQQYLNEPDTDR